MSTNASAARRRPLFQEEHRSFRESVARFVADEVVPAYEGWGAAGGMPAEIYAAAAQHGFVGMQVAEEHGGVGVDDVRFNAVLGEEAMHAGVPAFGLGLATHNDVCVPALLAHAGDRAAAWAPGLASGELPAAFADAALTAVRRGEGWALEGEAPYVLGGGGAGLLVAVAIEQDGDEPALFALSADAGGLRRTASPGLIGLHAADLASLSFAGAAAERLAGPDAVAAARADQQLSLAVAAVAGARAALAITVEYVHERRAFGQPIARFENTRMALAAVAAEADAAEALVDACLAERNAGELLPARAAAAKLRATGLQARAVDGGVQLHGGYGYMSEYAIARAYADARFLRVYGGADTALLATVASSIGL